MARIGFLKCYLLDLKLTELQSKYTGPLFFKPRILLVLALTNLCKLSELIDSPLMESSQKRPLICISRNESDD